MVPWPLRRGSPKRRGRSPPVGMAGAPPSGKQGEAPASAEGIAGRPARKPRSTFTLSLPRDEVEELEGFVARFGRRLGYNGRIDFLRTAIRNQMRSDEARLLRQNRLDDEINGEDAGWSEKPR
jgi:hypothetical protein